MNRYDRAPHISTMTALLARFDEFWLGAIPTSTPTLRSSNASSLNPLPRLN